MAALISFGGYAWLGSIFNELGQLFLIYQLYIPEDLNRTSQHIRCQNCLHH